MQQAASVEAATTKICQPKVAGRVRSQSPGALKQQARRDARKRQRIARIPITTGDYTIDRDIWHWFKGELQNRRIEWLEDGARVLAMVLRMKGAPAKWDEEFFLCPDTLSMAASKKFGFELSADRCEHGIHALAVVGVVDRLGPRHPSKDRDDAKLLFKLPIAYAFNAKFKDRLAAIPRKTRYEKSAKIQTKPTNISLASRLQTFRTYEMSAKEQANRPSEVKTPPSFSVQTTISQFDDPTLQAKMQAFANLFAVKSGIDAATVDMWQQMRDAICRALPQIAIADVLSGDEKARLAIDCARVAIEQIAPLLGSQLVREDVYQLGPKPDKKAAADKPVQIQEKVQERVKKKPHDRQELNVGFATPIAALPLLVALPNAPYAAPPLSCSALRRFIEPVGGKVDEKASEPGAADLEADSVADRDDIRRVDTAAERNPHDSPTSTIATGPSRARSRAASSDAPLIMASVCGTNEKLIDPYYCVK